MRIRNAERKTIRCLCAVWLVVGAAASSATAQTEEKKKPARKDIYNPKADAKADIKAATAKAKKEGKHVLLMFGGNWCTWCHALHDLFEKDKDIAKVLADGYVVVLVDSRSNEDLDKEYGEPYQHGFPVLVVLDGDGKRLHIQESVSLEKADKSTAHEPAKVLEFLKKWAPKPKAAATQPSR